MKIALPLHNNKFSSHFGGAEAFALYTVDEQSNNVTSRELMTPPEHGRGVYPVWLKKQGASVVLASGMGPRAADIFTSMGIVVMLGVQGEDPDELVQQYLAGTLVGSGSLCHEHGFHDCGHHEQRGGTCEEHHHE